MYCISSAECIGSQLKFGVSGAVGAIKKCTANELNYINL